MIVVILNKLLSLMEENRRVVIIHEAYKDYKNDRFILYTGRKNDIPEEYLSRETVDFEEIDGQWVFYIKYIFSVKT